MHALFPGLAQTWTRLVQLQILCGPRKAHAMTGMTGIVDRVHDGGSARK